MFSHWLDKNGREIKSGCVLLHDNGEKYELFGTGIRLPHDLSLWAWSSDNKIVYLNTAEVVVINGKY